MIFILMNSKKLSSRLYYFSSILFFLSFGQLFYFGVVDVGLKMSILFTSIYTLLMISIWCIYKGYKSKKEYKKEIRPDLLYLLKEGFLVINYLKHSDNPDNEVLYKILSFDCDGCPDKLITYQDTDNTCVLAYEDYSKPLRITRDILDKFGNSCCSFS